MPPPVPCRARRRLPIIAVLLAAVVALSGCGMALRLGYDQGDAIAFRWLDGYVDFDDAQSLRVRAGLDEWFAWHRRTQLLDYADLLARAENEVLANTTPERMCAWANEIRRRIDVGFEHARPALIDVLPTLSARQIANIEKKFAERNDTFRDDHLQRDPRKRRDAAVDREIERAEKLYGGLDDAQRARVAQSVAESPFDAEAAYAERLRRQQDLLALLRRVSMPGATHADADAELRAYVQRLDASPNEAYRRYVGRLIDYNCVFAATLHDMTSATQRTAAVARLQGWESDLRGLAADARR